MMSIKRSFGMDSRVGSRDERFRLLLWVFGGSTMNLIWTDQNCMGVKSSVSRFIVMSIVLESNLAAYYPR